MATNANLPKTGYTNKTPDRFLLNAGALVKNLKWDKEGKKWEYDPIGATSGGSKLTLKNELRQAEVDGVFAPVVGGDMIESSEGVFEINCIEHTFENMKTMLQASVTDSDGTEYPEGYHVIKPGRKIAMENYVENLAYIGSLSGSDKPVIIIMHHSICTSGLELEVKDKEEAIYPMTYEARAGAEDVENTSLPVTILFPKEEAASNNENPAPEQNPTTP